MERFDYFRRVLHLGCLIFSCHTTVYLTTFSHTVFSDVTVTGTSEMDSFSIILYGFQPFIALFIIIIIIIIFIIIIIIFIIIIVIIIIIIITINVIFIIVTIFARSRIILKVFHELFTHFYQRIDSIPVVSAVCQLSFLIIFFCNRFILNCKFVKIRL